jgi:hypothetical protein
VTEKGRSERPWMVWALPEDLAVLLPPTILTAAAEIGHIRTLLGALGIRRDALAGGDGQNRKGQLRNPS